MSVLTLKLFPTHIYALALIQLFNVDNMSVFSFKITELKPVLIFKFFEHRIIITDFTVECTMDSQCMNGGTCDMTTSTCMCETTYTGDNCDTCKMLSCNLKVNASIGKKITFIAFSLLIVKISL